LQSNSSTESDSLPFANENAGTIKQRAARAAQEYVNSPSHIMSQHQQHQQQQQQQHHHTSNEPADVLSDIGNMLTNLTNELDAMLEEEKRQGLNP
jgi:hypothetical protein